MKLIINADDFGMSETVNDAIVDGYKNGILTSTCIMANMPAFEDAVSKLSKLDGIGIGVHLNIIEKKTISQFPRKDSKLYNKEGFFNNGFLQLMIKSCNADFIKEVEQEFRMQIEEILKYTQPDHIDSHVHIHAIPKIFELVCKLAKEYNIPCVRTQFEHPYFDGNLKNFINPKYYINIIKVIILNFFTNINKKTAEKYKIHTNNAVIGVGYTGMMNIKAIEKGINIAKKKNYTLEVICHPDLNKKRKSNYREYLTITNPELINFVKNFNIKSFKDFIK